MPKQVSLSFMLLSILLSVCFILSNLFATKIITVFGLSATAGLIVFPVSYIINDTIVEVWGYRKARLVIWLAFAINFLAILLMQLSVKLPHPAYWTGQDAYAAAFSQAPRVAAASLIAFLFGSFTNAYVMSRMKVSAKGKNFGVRAIVSTLFGESADTLLFCTVAFAGMVAWKNIAIMIVAEILLKSAYEAVILPVTNLVVRYIKRTEQSDVFDENISYNILRVKDVS
jgi:uncharacterized integral membrane protein (TIGR00697 family)